MLDPPLRHWHKFFGARVWEGGSKKLKIISDLQLHAKFRNPTITPSGRKVHAGEQRRRREKNSVNSGHLVP
jgi:hypothetical protein